MRFLESSYSGLVWKKPYENGLHSWPLATLTLISTCLGPHLPQRNPQDSALKYQRLELIQPNWNLHWPSYKYMRWRYTAAHSQPYRRHPKHCTLDRIQLLDTDSSHPLQLEFHPNHCPTRIL